MKSEKKLRKIKNRNRESLRRDFTIGYMQKQFPWFLESDILKAIELKGPHLEDVINYLNDKSGTPKNHDNQDY